VGFDLRRSAGGGELLRARPAQVAITKLSEIHAATHPGAKLASARAVLDAILEAEAED